MRALLIAPLVALPTAAHAECTRDRARPCYILEHAKPDTSRSGLSASEYCAAEAIASCADTSKRYQAPTGTHFAPPTPTKAPPVDTSKLSEIVVPGGKLTIFDGDPYATKAYIRYNDKLIKEFTGAYLAIESILFVDGDAVLIYSENAGGSGTPDGFGLIAIVDKGKIYQAELPVGTGRFEYSFVSGVRSGNHHDRIDFELGFEEGKEVRAIYANGRLDVTRTAAPKAGLNAKDCELLYGSVLDSCADQNRFTCKYDDMVIGMVYERQINRLHHDDPNFRYDDFTASCERTCKTKKKPAWTTFRQAVCLPR